MKIRFLLLGEGASDGALVLPLERLCILAGAAEASGFALAPERLGAVGRTVGAKVEAALRLEPEVDLLFIHRDSDSPDAAPRFAEIETAIAAVAPGRHYVGVVPVQATEAWALLDEAAIRRVAENPNGRRALSLPTPKSVELLSDPKRHLKEILAAASELRGRRLERFAKAFPRQRRALLESLDLAGPIQRAASFQRLVGDIARSLAKLERSS